jgi:hypothetical protein
LVIEIFYKKRRSLNSKIRFSTFSLQEKGAKRKEGSQARRKKKRRLRNFALCGGRGGLRALLGASF